MHDAIWQGRMKVEDGITFAGQLTPRWTDYPGFSGWAQSNPTGVLEVGEGGRREDKGRERDVMTEAEVGVAPCEEDPNPQGWLCKWK